MMASVYGATKERFYEPLWDQSYEFEKSDLEHDSMLQSGRVDVCDSTALLQAVVFVEDAVKYRSINHKIDPVSLWYYRLYYSKPVQWLVYAAITVIHLLAFFERPSSLTWSSDPYYRGVPTEVPCWLIASLEFLCLAVFVVDVLLKIYLIGRKQLWKTKWLIAYVVIVTFSLGDWFVTVVSSCSYSYRFRRILRPFFLLQNSSLMKKTMRSIKNTVPKVLSVLCMVMLHVFIFSVCGMILFPKHPRSSRYCGGKPEPDQYKEGAEYFNNITTSFISLLVLLTTANNPDVTMPAYQVNRLYSLYFITFLGIGLYFFFNMLTAVIYNEFRGFFFNSMQASYFRRRLGFQAAFEMLRRQGGRYVNQPYSAAVGAGVVKSVILQAKIKRSARKAIIQELDSMMGSSLTAADFQQLFDVLDRETIRPTPPLRNVTTRRLKRIQQLIAHKGFVYIGMCVATVNVLVISVEIALQDQNTYSDSGLILVNIGCTGFYCFEQVAKIWALGWPRYRASWLNRFDGVLTVVLLFFTLFTVIVFAVGPDANAHSPSDVNEVVVFIPFYDLTRIINMLIIFRFLRLISMFETMSVVAGTLVDLVRNLKALIGSLVVIYYVYAILGMEIFQNKIHHPGIRKLNNYSCGSYEQLDYWANNFDDFASSLVVLWDVMVVNNWHIFLDVYSRDTKGWSKMYFIAWYFTSVLVFMNVFTALILENFIFKWDRRLAERNADNPDRTPAYLVSLHTMFRSDLHEPTEEELLREIHSHPHIQHLRV
ncbi:two pore channel protein 2-like isoform X2 [Apostichopus japonicus]|uniref:two pore channel protein 2-like isoform X2 n=1 Tax=Stichopus japonicus TaxID=307972 RepID=UPI003AB35D21